MLQQLQLNIVGQTEGKIYSQSKKIQKIKHQTHM